LPPAECSARLATLSPGRIAQPVRGKARAIARSRVPGLDGMYDGGHGADQLPESLDWPGFAGDVDVGV
jgi:hypothetical protein